MRTLLLSLSFAVGLTPAQERLLAPADVPGRAQAAAELQAVLAVDADLPTSVALAACAGVTLAPGSTARARLVQALQRANGGTDPAAARATLRSELGDLIETLTFRPVQQAELPTGFPGFAAVDEIELRDYPIYRMVRTSMQGGSTGAFWPLFRHIESNGIAMTTPVQMDWQSQPGAAHDRPMQMAFLYGDPTITPKRTDDGVEVVEMPAVQVLSIGAIGDDRRDRVEELRDRLLAWLGQNPEWEVAGALRTMGYNSPMVSRDRRYFEAQLPVRRRAAPGAVLR
jgi:SOUL heme-binding protein